MHRRLFNVMASQVRPGSTKPERPRGPQQSIEQMRRRPAHSIRARELVSHTQAECKAALSSRDPELKISLGMQGRPCKGLEACHPRRPFRLDGRTHSAGGRDSNGCISRSASSALVGGDDRCRTTLTGSAGAKSLRRCYAAGFHQDHGARVDVRLDRGVDLVAGQRLHRFGVAIEPARIVAALRIRQDGLG